MKKQIMQRLLGWVLQRFTPFRVIAWSRGRIAGIGASQIFIGDAVDLDRGSKKEGA